MAQSVIGALHAETVTEFFLPRDMPHFCVGCFTCFESGEDACPHADDMRPIRDALLAADLVIFTTPIYALRCSGQMKALLDHFAYQFMIHRPPVQYFSKTALLLATTAGAGLRGALGDIKVSLRFWGTGRIFTYGIAVASGSWDGVSEKKKAKIAKKTAQLSNKIEKSVRRRKTGLMPRLLFMGHRMAHRKFVLAERDHAHWQDQGWLEKERPWKRKQ